MTLAKYVKRVLEDAGHARQVKKVKLKDEDLAPFRLRYEAAVVALKDVHGKADKDA